MDDLQLSSGTYRVSKFPNAVKQLQVARRLGPVFVKMGSLVEALERLFPNGTDGPAASATVDLKELLGDVEPFAGALADMPEDRFEYIINSCLDVCYRQTGAGGGFSPIRINGQQMFEDIPPSDIMQLVFAVIQENLSGFTTGLNSTSRT